MVRGKNPEVDLKRKYRATFEKCLLVSLALHLTSFSVSRKVTVAAYEPVKQQVVIQIEDIPETKQEVKRPPAPKRPAVPIEVESEELPDDVTIETTELDVWEENIPPPPPPAAAEAPPPEDDEIVPFWHVESPPELVHAVPPIYPEIARKAQMEGKIFLHLLVGKNGQVEEVKFIKGPEIFKEAAIKAARQFRFSPALQNDKPVRVWMAIPIDFKLTGSSH
ncbi:MAG: energy transducer TonB [Candidatus Latescibacteria bacterium]|nr:energy transducer TonB [Candidatus Latescibacterota bacterium]